MFCTSCGATVSEESIRCSQCGKVVREELVATAASTKTKESWMEDFFSFQKMVSPLIIKIVYVLGVIVMTISGLAMLFEGEMMMLAGLGLITVGNLIWRVACEGGILLFSMHDILGSIEKNLKKK